MNHRILKWASYAALVLMMGLSLFSFTPKVLARTESAAKLYKQGQAAEAREDVETAYADYYKAYQLKPTDLRYKTAYERTRFTAASLFVKHGETLRDQGDMTGALTEFLHALAVDPSNELAQQEIQRDGEGVMGAPGKNQTQNRGDADPARWLKARWGTWGALST